VTTPDTHKKTITTINTGIAAPTSSDYGRNFALVLHLVNFVPFVVVGILLLHYNSRHPRSVAEEPRPQDPVPV
jgi:hypothetical protein